jgi:hypothetical protein
MDSQPFICIVHYSTHPHLLHLWYLSKLLVFFPAPRKAKQTAFPQRHTPANKNSTNSTPTTPNKNTKPKNRCSQNNAP